MKLGMRWFGSNDDPIPLAYLRQVPGVTQVIGALFDVPVGEPWPLAAVTGLRDQVVAAGLSLEVIESVNVHDDIKTSGPGRDWAIENYLTTIFTVVFGAFRFHVFVISELSIRNEPSPTRA